jgi:hypothetical protein
MARRDEDTMTDIVEAEKLVPLIERAVATLASAKTAVVRRRDPENERAADTGRAAAARRINQSKPIEHRATRATTGTNRSAPTGHRYAA